MEPGTTLHTRVSFHPLLTNQRTLEAWLRPTYERVTKCKLYLYVANPLEIGLNFFVFQALLCQGGYIHAQAMFLYRKGVWIGGVAAELR